MATLTGSPDEAGREAELALGRLRGRLAELNTQVARAEQDLDLPRSFWAGRRAHQQVIAWRSRIVGRLRRRRTGPLVSIITPVFNTPEHVLRACLASVAGQTHQHWEHLLVDDGSSEPWVAPLLARAARHDRRRRVTTLATNSGIAAASSAALESATGEYIAMLDHDDVLVPNALARLVERLHGVADVMAYSDHALLRPDGEIVEPFYKPDFSPERLRNHNYITHFVVARLEAVRRVGGFRAGFDGAQDHDLVLRLSEIGRVAHVPEVLYLWRQSASSVASDSAAKPYAFNAGILAVAEHCERVGVAASVERGASDGLYRVRRVSATRPLVSVIVPTRGTSAAVWGKQRCLVVEALASLAGLSTYPNLQFVVVADSDTPTAVLDRLRADHGNRLRLVDFAEPFNFSAKINVGARHADGEVLLLLNDDTELVEPTSIEAMVDLLAQDVGIVGARLWYGDGTMQHAGHVYPGLCTHALLGYPGDHPGPSNMAAVERECSGVTAAAAVITRTVFEELGGFDEAFAANFNDVDLCLRVGRSGRRVLWTPHATWYHFESASRDPSTTDAERDLLLARWTPQITHDPYHHPLLAPHRSDWLERPGHSGSPPWYLDGGGCRRYV